MARKFCDFVRFLTNHFASQIGLIFIKVFSKFSSSYVVSTLLDCLTIEVILMPHFAPVLKLGALAIIPFFSLSDTQVAWADKAEALAVLVALTESEVTSIQGQSDAADRIRLADRLTMLTQRVAASSCALTSDVAIEESHYFLEEATDEFDIILDALRNGNEALHILGPEENRRTLHDLDMIEEEWMATHGAIDAVIADGHDVENAHIIDDHNLELLRRTSILASDINGQYSNPFEISQADAMLINIAGRQRMLTQKMAKDACEIWTGYHAEDGRKDLMETMVIFENSMNALRYGMPDAGIQAAPTPEIEKDLDIILERWDVIRGNLDILLAGGELEMAGKYEIFHDFNLELDELEHLIHDYKVYVERHHD